MLAARARKLSEPVDESLAAKAQKAQNRIFQKIVFVPYVPFCGSFYVLTLTEVA
jgi:hypothetical protein